MKKTLGILLLLGAAGGAAYYFLVYRKKKNGAAGTSVTDQLKDLISGKDIAPASTETTAPSTATPGILPGDFAPGTNSTTQAGTTKPATDNTPIVPSSGSTTPDMSNPSSFRGATFYEHPYRGYTTPYQERNHGWAVKLPPGEYPSGIILGKLGIVNDQVSSVDVDPSIKVIMYKDANFKGQKVELSKYIEYLKTVGFDNAMSSVSIIDEGGYSFAGTRVR